MLGPHGSLDPMGGYRSKKSQVEGEGDVWEAKYRSRGWDKTGVWIPFYERGMVVMPAYKKKDWLGSAPGRLVRLRKAPLDARATW